MDDLSISRPAARLLSEGRATGQPEDRYRRSQALITDGPYLETKEHVGGFWVLEAADLNEALVWGRKAAVACRAPVEVHPFLPPFLSK